MKLTLHPGTAMAAFFALLLLINVAFYVIALSHPPELLPTTTPAKAVVTEPATPAAEPTRRTLPR